MYFPADVTSDRLPKRNPSALRRALARRLASSLCLAGATVLPLLAGTIPAARAAAVSSGFVVKEFKFEGNTVFKNKELQEVVAPYTGRKLNAAGIEEARIKVSKFYIDKGYINSGAQLAGTDPRAGIVSLRIVEGKIGRVNIQGNRWLSNSYLEPRLRRGADDPYNEPAMRDNIAELRRYDLSGSIVGLDASLQPDKGGSSVLDVNVKDQQPFRASLVYDNRRPAGVGAQEVAVILEDVNVSGVNDDFRLDYVIAREDKDNSPVFSDKDNIAVSYTRPLTSFDTTISLSYSRQDFTVVEQPFQDLDIDSNERVYSIALRQPIIRKKNFELAFSLQMDREESHTSLLGVPFTLSPGAINGQADLTVFRFAQDLTYQRDADVFAFRSTFNLGTKLFGGTEDQSDRDAKFFSWRGEAQYVRRFSVLGRDNVLVLRGNGQATSDPLLVLEQYSVGGRYSVRGYRENELVRDSGYLFSAEVHIPIIKDKAGDPLIQLAPFSDMGGGFNNEAATPKPRFLASVGIGLLLTYKQHVYGELYYGYALKDVQEAQGSNRDLQDDGIHFFLQVGEF